MSTLVVFDSTFGNTEVVARAIAEVLATASPVRTLRVDTLEPWHLEEIDLLVVGAPTRSGRPSPAVRGWLAGLPPGRLLDVEVAAFDTRSDPSRARLPFARLLARWLGPASTKLERALVGLGGAVAAPAEGFVLEAVTGPLREGETDRARAWARALKERSSPRSLSLPPGKRR